MNIALLLGCCILGSNGVQKHKEFKLRIVTYNIRHGAGKDDKVDIPRIGAVLRALKPDIVGLQEVDKNVLRSGSIDEASELGKMLGMHAGFGSFMDYQGGDYGMGMLAKYPLNVVKSIRLPEGNEPRIALAGEVKLPSGESVMVVNVHFDWVADDGFRFAQATFLADYLKRLELPYILLGDFNDEPGSRTLKLFQSLAKEAVKPKNDHFTFSSTKPDKEIDFIFVSPKERWTVVEVRVIDEPMASDHRPVFAEVTLK